MDANATKVVFRYIYIYIYTHIYTYIHIYIYMCVCVCVYARHYVLASYGRGAGKLSGIPENTGEYQRTDANADDS
jgi:hypothetical protein